MSTKVWDPGLQPERTGLAWVRLGLGMMAISFAVLRVAWGQLGWWSVPAALAALLSGVLLLLVGHRRYNGWLASLSTSDALASGGTLPLVITLVTLLLGVTGVALLLV